MHRNVQIQVSTMVVPMAHVQYNAFALFGFLREFFFKSYFLASELYISQAFQQHQAHQILTP